MILSRNFKKVLGADRHFYQFSKLSSSWIFNPRIFDILKRISKEAFFLRVQFRQDNNHLYRQVQRNVLLKVFGFAVIRKFFCRAVRKICLTFIHVMFLF